MGHIKVSVIRIVVINIYCYNKIIHNNDLAGYGSGTKVAAKATSATSARYATTATNAGSASKATSATSSTYSSTANYAKNAPQYKGATTAAAGTKGLVPAATTAMRLRFLRGDGTWSTPTVANYKGATSSAAGTAGLVPAATTATKNYFLRGDGKWEMPSSVAVEGNVRYNDVTDKLEIYFEGVWSPVLSCGLQIINLISADYVMTRIGASKGNYSINYTNGINILYDNSGQNYSSATWIKPEYIDISAFDTLNITFTANIASPGSSSYNKVCVEFYDENSNTIFSKNITPTSGQNAYNNITKKIDISAYEGRCRFGFQTHSNNIKVNLSVTSLYLD